MDVTATTNTTNNSTMTGTTTSIGGVNTRCLSITRHSKSPEIETNTPPRIQPAKIIPFINGVLKRRNNHRLLVVPGGGGVTYNECLKNHAASLGGHALDGCGEFMPAPCTTATDSRSHKCAACGCHRNFHRRDLKDVLGAVAAAQVTEYHPQHRRHPPPPHTLLALSSGGGTGVENNNHHHMNVNATNQHHLFNTSDHILRRKRFRTKFSQEQKEKMHKLAEKVGWKMVKSNEDLVNGFCSEIGVERGVFKVWMHNKKITIGKRSGSINHGISANQGGNGVKSNDNHMKEDEEIVNGNGVGNTNSSSINNSHTISHQQPSNGSTSSS